MELEKKNVKSTLTSKEIDQNTLLNTNYLSKEYELPEFGVNTETEKRKKVIATLQSYVEAWQAKLKETLNQTDEGDARLVVYGSFSMDVSAKDGDLDTLLVAPDYVERDKHFFGSFLEKLRESKEITELQAIKDAYVPLIKLKISSIMVDIVFARVNRKELKPDMNFTENLLREMDAEMIRSINAYRTGKKILELVPDIANFQTTLRAIKLWARRKAIYYNSQGFFSGISCAILTAKICKQYPELKPVDLIYAFFKTFAFWPWQEKPVVIDDNQLSSRPNVILAEKSWTENDKSYMMVITPVYPFSNTTFNVSYITWRVIIRHIEEAYRLLEECRQEGKPYNWDSLFEPYEFFRNYIHFLEVRIFSNNSEQFLKWKGLIEARLKVLTRNLEVIPRASDFSEDQSRITIHPYPFPIQLKESQDFQHCYSYYYGIKMTNALSTHYSKKMDLTQPVQDFVHQEIIHKRMEMPDCQIAFLHLTREELPNSVFGTEERPPWATKHMRYGDRYANGNKLT